MHDKPHCEACGSSRAEDCTCLDDAAILKEIEAKCPGLVEGMEEALRPVLIHLGERIATLEAENKNLRARLATDDLRQFARREASAESATAGKSQPSPKMGGVAVTPALISWLDGPEIEGLTPRDAGFCQAIIDGRAAEGLRKYGQPLVTGDARDTAVDAMQELGDWLQYAFKARLQFADSPQEIRRFLRFNAPLVNGVNALCKELLRAAGL